MPATTRSYSYAPRWIAILYAGVFFTFAPLWLLMISSYANEPPPMGLAFLFGLSGLVAVGYATAGMFTRKVLFLVIPAHIGAIVLCAKYAPFGTHRAPPSIEGLASVLSIALGYALFIIFITGEGARTLRLRTELALARTIHDTLVPPIRHRAGPLEVYASSSPSTEMGGDLIDLVATEAHTDVYLADVSGHGVRAGVVMAMVKSAIRTRLASGGDLSDIARDLNSVLHDLTPDEMFATFVCLRFRADASGADVVIAGHLPIFHLHADATISTIDNEALPLGVVPDEAFPLRTIELAPGDTLLAFTDGLSEASGPAGLLGLQPLRETLLREGRRPLTEIHDALLRVAREYAPQTDDQTVLLVRITEPGSTQGPDSPDSLR